MTSDSPPSRQVTTTLQGTTRTLECLEPWLDDGNIVLVVQDKCFRAHRTILASYSKVFKDMFTIPHPDDIKEDVIDKCPVIYLQDPVDEVQIMLRAFYDRSFVFFYSTPMPVSVLTAFLRMGKKYDVHQLFEEAKRRLSLSSPSLLCASELSAAKKTFLFPRISGNDPYNFTVMNVAAEVGIFSAVVMAMFYCCLACPAMSMANGYEFEGETVTLSPLNTAYCILAQSYLAEVDRCMIQMIGEVPKLCERPNQLPVRSCIASILLNIHRFQQRKSPFALWEPAWDLNLCNVCRAELRRRHEEARTQLWKKLPTALGLRAWEELDKESELIDS